MKVSAPKEFKRTHPMETRSITKKKKEAEAAGQRALMLLISGAAQEALRPLSEHSFQAN